MAEITITETERRRTEAQILDVREEFEVTQGMIPGALHIPMSELNDRLVEIDKTRPVTVVCASGNRSAQVADALAAVGYAADTMTGGMVAWQHAGLPPFHLTADSQP